MKEIIQKFNQIRINNQGVLFNRAQLKEAFKDFPYLQFDVFITALVNNRCIVKEVYKQHLYKFTECPVHISTMEIVMKQVRKKLDEYRQNRKEKKVVKPEINLDQAIKEAIKLLLNNGYEIYKTETIVKKTQITGVQRYLRVG